MAAARRRLDLRGVSVVIDHGNGYQSHYAPAAAVSAGQREHRPGDRLRRHDR
jgi:murein DD-endopeptidase MepM/ murein hydrolase activator NlpD